MSNYSKPTFGGIITSPYGWRVLNGNRGFHDGIDFVGDHVNGNTNIYSIAPGKVVYDFDHYDDKKRWSDKKHSAGNYIIIQHEIEGELYFVRYLHLGNNTVSVGDTVDATTILGNYADAGYSFGAHLHLDMYDVHWIKIDPTPVLKKMGVM